jgi:hypothetical protein
MGISALIKRFSYPHKKTAWKYFLDDPRLFFGMSSNSSKLHIGSVLERMFKTDMVSTLHSFLPQDLQDLIESENYRDREGYRLLLHLLVRKWKPDVVVETGVARGLSSAYILAAMRENNRGRLISIDLPPEDASIADSERDRRKFLLQDGQRHMDYEIGHFVPEWLRDRWTLVLEDAKVALPRILEEEKEIDFFYHDSLHTDEHMRFEYETSWPYIKEGGLLLSDDVLWADAFRDFAKKHDCKSIVFRSFGMITK